MLHPQFVINVIMFLDETHCKTCSPSNQAGNKIDKQD